MRASGRVLTRATLIEAVWGIDGNVEANTLDAFIRLLRKKLDDPFQTRLVHTVHGIGYRLSPEGE
jgi:DNA-binding response OmpR family regulator